MCRPVSVSFGVPSCDAFSEPVLHLAAESLQVSAAKDRGVEVRQSSVLQDSCVSQTQCGLCVVACASKERDCGRVSVLCLLLAACTLAVFDHCGSPTVPWR